MAKIIFVCSPCEATTEIEIYALSSDGFNITCPSCGRDFWFEACPTINYAISNDDIKRTKELFENNTDKPLHSLRASIVRKWQGLSRIFKKN